MVLWRHTRPSSNSWLSTHSKISVIFDIHSPWKAVFSDVEEIPEILNIQPHMFEPQMQINNDHIAQASSEESDNEVCGNDQIDRRANTIW